MCSSHKETPFQGNNSLFSQDQLSRLFPLGNHDRINSKEVGAILTADREFIKDGGDVKIKAELVGIEAFENDYFAIQCGSVIKDNAIIFSFKSNKKVVSSITFNFMHYCNCVRTRCL